MSTKTRKIQNFEMSWPSGQMGQAVVGDGEARSFDMLHLTGPIRRVSTSAFLQHMLGVTNYLAPHVPVENKPSFLSITKAISVFFIDVCMGMVQFSNAAQHRRRGQSPCQSDFGVWHFSFHTACFFKKLRVALVQPFAILLFTGATRSWAGVRGVRVTDTHLPRCETIRATIGLLCSLREDELRVSLDYDC